MRRRCTLPAYSRTAHHMLARLLATRLRFSAHRFQYLVDQLRGRLGALHLDGPLDLASYFGTAFSAKFSQFCKIIVVERKFRSTLSQHQSQNTTC
jgi:hypothetical protein